MDGDNEEKRIVVCILMIFTIVAFVIFNYTKELIEQEEKEIYKIETTKYKLASFILGEKEIVTPSESSGIFLLGVGFYDQQGEKKEKVLEYVFYLETENGGYRITRAREDMVEIYEDGGEEPFAMVKINNEKNCKRGEKYYYLHLPKNSIITKYNDIDLKSILKY